MITIFDSQIDTQIDGFELNLNHYLLYLIFIAGNEAISHLQTLFIDTLTKAFTCDDGQTEREENG